MKFKNLKTIKLLLCIAAGLYGRCAQAQSTAQHLTEGGAKYSFVEDRRDGEMAKVGDIMLIRFSLYMTNLQGRDTLIQNSDKVPGRQIPMPVKNPSFRGSFEEVLPKLSEGDSVHMLIEADSMVVMLSSGQSLPEFIDPQTDIRLCLRVVRIMSEQGYMAMMQEQQQRKEEEDKGKEAEAKVKNEEEIKQLLAANKIKATRTESGLYYKIDKKGSGDFPRPGQIVSVHYVGTLTNGEKFDSSRDRNAPLDFPHKAGQMIPGVDEAVGLLKKGGRGTFWLPAYLAHGGQQSGAVPPYSVLVFEIEITDIKPAPPDEHNDQDGHNHDGHNH